MKSPNKTLKSHKKTVSKIASGLLITILIIANVHADDVNGSMTFDGNTRTYILHIPSDYNANNPTSLILVFHGLTGTGSTIENVSQFNPIADEENFFVAYPDGLNKKWASPGGNVDDVGFIAALIDLLSTSYNIDANRIYAAGVSNGGMFTYRLALELTNVFAAIGDVAGYMPGYAPNPSPVPSRAISVVHFHGTADPTIPYEKAENAVDYWVDNDQCSTTPVIVALPNTDPNDGTTVDQFIYSGGTENTEVDLYKIYNGGHTWPGSSGSGMLGKICKDINASEIMWEFFKKHTLNTFPTVAFTAPGVNVSFTAPALIKMKATASDSDGDITKVEFFNGAQKLKTDLVFPYNCNWKNVPVGTYLLRAVATDNLGGISEDSINVTVNPPKLIPENTSSHSIHVFYDLAGQQLIINKPADDGVYDLLIYDAAGNNTLSIQSIGELSKIVSASTFTPGMYLYSIRTNNEDLIAGKFVVLQ